MTHRADFTKIGDCPNCGEEVCLVNTSDGWTVTEACAYPNGIPAYSVEVDVPSGRLAFANDFRRQFPLLDDFYVNLGSEIRRCTEAYAVHGCIHVFVGNTCPAVHKLDDGTIVVGVSGESKKERLPGKEVGHIGTDLWWVSLADHDHVMARAKQLGTKLDSDMEVVDVAPGRYRATVYRHLLGGSYSPTAAVYLTIENISDVSDQPFPPVPSADDLGFEQEILLRQREWHALVRRCAEWWWRWT